MSTFFNHQKTIGIVGASPDANRFIDRANTLGFITYQLNQNKEDRNTSHQADKTFVGQIDEESIYEEFIMKSDLLVYFDDSINSQQLELISQSIDIPQGEDLLAIARDRFLQKAFKESISVNIAPFETIITVEDIVEAMPSIGYPAVLRTNLIQMDNQKDVYFIYEEEDIEQASELLKYGTCVLESWVVSEHQLSVSVLKSATGEIQLYPIIEKHYNGERLESVKEFIVEEEELQQEIERVATLIASNIAFVGAMSIDFIVSPAQALYIDDIHPYPNHLSRYSEVLAGHSIVDSHLRAVTSLPLSPVKKGMQDFAYIPIYADQKDLVEEWILMYPDWQFVFYSFIKEKDAEIEANQEIGYVLIETPDIEAVLSLLKN